MKSEAPLRTPCLLAFTSTGFPYLCPRMNKPQKVAFHTLGCKLNYSETSSIGRLFSEKGYEKVSFDQEADVYVINTCSVTENADKECRKIVKDALNVAPTAKVIVTGCYAQLKPEQVAGIEGVDLVLGASEKFRLMEYLDEVTGKGNATIHCSDISQADFFVDAFSHGDRTRTFLKVQDGCDYSCTFCTIPMARGKSRSDSVTNVIANANKIAESGVREIVLTGVNLGDFGRGNAGGRQKEVTFSDLVKELENVDGIERFRISSIEPNLLTNEIIEFVGASKKFVPHFHIPLQSGSDNILKMMKRRYLSNLYSERVSKIRQVMPHACIGVDVIVGFPGESNEEFEKTYEFLNKLEISYLHVFTYSERDNTEAIQLKPVVPMPERKRRNSMLRILSAKKLRQFYEAHLNETRPVLFEQENKSGFMFGFTDNYIKIKTEFDPSLVNAIRMVELQNIDSEGYVRGEVRELEASFAI